MKKPTIFLAILILMLTGCNSANINRSSDEMKMPSVRFIPFSTDQGKAIKEQLAARKNSLPDNPTKDKYKIGGYTVEAKNESLYLLNDNGSKTELLSRKPSHDTPGEYLKYYFSSVIDDHRFEYYYYETAGEGVPGEAGFGIYDLAEMKDHPIWWDTIWFSRLQGYSLDRFYPVGDFFIWGKIDSEACLRENEIYHLDLSTYETRTVKLKRPLAYYSVISPDGKYLVEANEDTFDTKSTTSTFYISDTATGEYKSFAVKKEELTMYAIFTENRKFYVYTDYDPLSPNTPPTFCYEVTF